MEDMVRYLNEIVAPTLADFEANPTSVRHAFIACVATFHAVDYLAYPRRSREARQRFRDQSADFALVDRIAHAFKHVTTGHENAPGNPRLTFRGVIPRPPAYWGAVWGLSRWGDRTGGVTLDHDRNIDLLAVVKRAVEFLREQTRAS